MEAVPPMSKTSYCRVYFLYCEWGIKHTQVRNFTYPKAYSKVNQRTPFKSKVKGLYTSCTVYATSKEEAISVVESIYVSLFSVFNCGYNGVRYSIPM